MQVGFVRRRNVGWNRHCTMYQLAKHISNHLNNINDKLYNIVTGASQYYTCSLLVCGWRHNVSLTSQIYFSRLFETLWNHWRWCWLLDKHDKWSWPPYFKINPVPTITYWWIQILLQGATITVGTQIRSGSTIIDTRWCAKIDAQQLYYFMILPVGGTLIDLAASMKARLILQRCPWNFDICQVQRMLFKEPWENPSCTGGDHWL